MSHLEVLRQWFESVRHRHGSLLHSCYMPGTPVGLFGWCVAAALAAAEPNEQPASACTALTALDIDGPLAG